MELINFKSKVNAINLIYKAELDLKMQKIDIVA